MPRTKKSGATNTESTRNLAKPQVEASTVFGESQELKVVELDNELRIKSTDIALQLGIDHESLVANITRYEAEIKAFGVSRFEMEKLSSTGRPTKVYYLNEDQSLFIGTISKNTEQVVKFKMVLVRAFSEARNKNKPQTTLDLLKLAISEIEAKDKIIELQKPAVEFHSQIHKAINSITVKMFAKALGTGQNRLFGWLRQENYLIDSQTPYQQYIDHGYFKVIEKTREVKNKRTGEIKIVTYFQTLITGKGQTYLQNKYQNSNQLQLA